MCWKSIATTSHCGRQHQLTKYTPRLHHHVVGLACWLTPVVSTPPCLLPQDGHKQITNTLYEYTTEQLELAFEGQFHYGTHYSQSNHWNACSGVLIKLATCVLLRPGTTGVVYAYVKLKEQETKNIVFFCDCIEQGHTPELGDIIPVFSKHSKWRTR